MAIQSNTRQTSISLLLTTAILLVAIPAMGSIVCPGPSTLQGVDVSLYNGTIDWNVVAASGIRFAFARISEGSYLDPALDQNYAAIKAAGLARGAYESFHPGQDAGAQATLVVQKIGLLRQGDLPPALDLEVTDGQTPATIIAKIQTWTAIVQNAIGRPPIILTSALCFSKTSKCLSG